LYLPWLRWVWRQVLVVALLFFDYGCGDWLKVEGKDATQTLRKKAAMSLPKGAGRPCFALQSEASPSSTECGAG
jgi:hypothetical protein